MMILTAIAAVFSLLQILSFTAKGFSSGLTGVLFNGYQFVVLYSLYDMFRQEQARGGKATYVAPGGIS